MVEIKQGDAYELIKALPDKSIDLIYTDVLKVINFMEHTIQSAHITLQAQIKKTKQNYKHPTIKPLRIVKNHIVNSYELNKVIKVLDPFVGSWATAVACQELGLDFIGFELKQLKIDCRE